MTKLIAFLFFISFCFSHQVLAENCKDGNDYTRHCEQLAPNTDSTFSVENETQVVIGWVTIHLADQSNPQIDVTGIGTFTMTISDAPTSCIINGQSIGYGIPTWVNIDEHTWVHATWTTNVIVINDAEQY